MFNPFDSPLVQAALAEVKDYHNHADKGVLPYDNRCGHHAGHLLFASRRVVVQG